MVALQTGALTSALVALDVKPEIIDQVVGILASSAGDLSGAEFATAGAIPTSSFGDRASAKNLGNHYDLAMQATQQAIDDLAGNLTTFAENARTAVTYVQDADGDGAVGLNQVLVAIEQMHESAQSSQDGS